MHDYMMMSSFARMVELLNLRVQYDDLVINGGFIMPKNARGQLTYEKAQWVLKCAQSKYEGHERLDELLDVAHSYVELWNLEEPEVRLLI